MSQARPKTPKRKTDAKANGRKNRGHRSQGMPNPLTKHRCEICGKRRADKWSKVPRMKYGSGGNAAHPYCSKRGAKSIGLDDVGTVEIKDTAGPITQLPETGGPGQ